MHSKIETTSKLARPLVLFPSPRLKVTLKASLYSWKCLLRLEIAVAQHTRPSPRLIPSKNAKRQQQCRRKSTLMTKACEYSKMCDADGMSVWVYGGVSVRRAWKYIFFSADPSGFWAFLGSHLLGRHRYPLSDGSPPMHPEFILSDPKASNGSRSL